MYKLIKILKEKKQGIMSWVEDSKANHGSIPILYQAKIVSSKPT